MAKRGRGTKGQGLLTILFTDLAGSTALTQRLGDARAQEVVRAHNAIVRREVRARGGTEIKHTGDGIMATFPSAARAVACAVAIQRGVVAHSETHPEMAFAVKIGMNAGEPVAEDSDVFGTAVQLAARTCDKAQGGQILATNVVRELVFGKGALFADAGTAEMKGFGEPVHLFEVGVGESGIDEGASDSQRSTLRWAIAGALAFTVAGAGAVALIFMLSAGDDAGARDEPAYREVSSHLQYESALKILGGDCISTDLRIEGTNSGSWAGDISGAYLSTSEVVVVATEQCQTVKLTSSEAFADSNGNTFTGLSFGLITSRIGDIDGLIVPGTTTSVFTPGVITGGTGLYQNATGTYLCETIATVQDELRSRSDGDCIVHLFVERPSTLIIAAAPERKTIGVSLNTKGEPDVTRVFGIYHNPTDQALEGARIRVVTEGGVELAVEYANPAGSDPTDELGWDIPPMGAGETAYFDVTMRLRSSETDTIDVAIEVQANGLAEPALSEPITLEVVR